MKNAANIAIGKGNVANMGSVNVEDSKVTGAIINSSNVKNAANIAIGKDNTANMGSVDIQ